MVEIWKRVQLASRAAHIAANRAVGYETHIITEVVLVPMYASVDVKRALWRARKHPKANRGLRLMKAIGGEL